MKHFTPYAKAIISGLVAALTALSVAIEDGTVTPDEGIRAALAFFVALTTVWAIPNATTAPPSDAADRRYNH